MNTGRWLYLLPAMLLTGCFSEQRVEVSADFSHATSSGYYTVPATVVFDNTSTGADFYAWSFAGGKPSSSSLKQPDPVLYTAPGTYVVVLEAWNDNARQRTEKIIQVDSTVTVAFDTDIFVNNFAPVDVQFTNRSQGGRTYYWTFEEGDPPASTHTDPEVVRFSTAGTHKAKLTVDNGHELFSDSTMIEVKPPLQVDFDIVPRWEDDAYEVPFGMQLVNRSVSALYYTWSIQGTSILSDTARNTEAYFETAGTYTICLTAGNHKDNRSVEKEIVLAPNTNLYIFRDIRLGVTTAQHSVGCFYSCGQRRVYTSPEITGDTGPDIDLVFLGLASGFTYCRFISPDAAGNFTFDPIPGAGKTHIVNAALPESPVYCTPAMFDTMVDDALLRTLPIAGNDSGEAIFTKAQAPHVVLFETQDGRRGAVKIKVYTDAGQQSYIIADIKVQKKKER